MVKPPKKAQKKTSAYHRFLSEKMQSAKGSANQALVMSQAPVEWGTLDHAAKAPYIRAARREHVRRGAAPEAVSDGPESFATPWGLGDARFPFALSTLQEQMRKDLNIHVNTTLVNSQQWRDQHGQFIIPADEDVFPDRIDVDENLCSHLYGVGKLLFALR